MKQRETQLQKVCPGQKMSQKAAVFRGLISLSLLGHYDTQLVSVPSNALSWQPALPSQLCLVLAPAHLEQGGDGAPIRKLSAQHPWKSQKLIKVSVKFE